MKTFVVIVIVLAIIHIIIRDYWHIITGSWKTMEPEVIEGERSIDEIMEGKNFHDLFEELDSKDYDDLTDDELHVLYNVTKWFEDNHGRSDAGMTEKI